MKTWTGTFKFRHPGGQITTERELLTLGSDNPLTEEGLRAHIDAQHGKGAFVSLVSIAPFEGHRSKRRGDR